MFKMACAAFVGATLLYSSITFAQALETRASSELIVLLAVDDTGSTGDRRVLTGMTEPGAGAALRSRLQNPVKARPLIRTRLDPAQRAQLRKDDPEELLQQFVVLTYPSSEVANAAMTRLVADRSVRSVSVNSSELSYSTVPADPYYPVVASAFDYQWALHRLSMESMWSKVRGTAYVGHIDNGIQASPIHPDLAAAYRPQFNFNAYSTTNNVDEMFSVSSTPTYAGHGTHTAGILAATASLPNSLTFFPNSSPEGVAGVCWSCSLIIAKISDLGAPQQMSNEAITNGLTWAIQSGAQVLSLSFGRRFGSTNYRDCAATPDDVFCIALAFAARREVVVVAATGNRRVGSVDFPASDPSAIAAGATQITPLPPNDLWAESSCVRNIDFCGSNYGSAMQEHGVVAPGRDIASTFYTARNWNLPDRCGDQYQPTGALGPGYGLCTGTSMAAPHVAGIVALMRTVEPLATVADVKQHLFSSGDELVPTAVRGYGFPDANAAVDAIAATTNRLTPLFGMYSNVAQDHVYMVSPQMAAAALAGTLPPYAGAGSAPYAPVGNLLANYQAFPGMTGVVPRAIAWVFSTHVDPYGTQELAPLIRLSYGCPQGNPVHARCAQNGSHVDHVYTTDPNEIPSFAQQGYLVDGTEGYVFPKHGARSVGSEALYRGYNAARDDYSLFLERDRSSMSSAGYNSNVTLLGYAYGNTGSRPQVGASVAAILSIILGDDDD